MISKKDKAMANEYLANPKLTKTQAYALTHEVRDGTKPNTLHKSASLAFSNPQVMAYLAKYSNAAEEGLVEVIEASKKYALEGGRDGASYAGTAVSGYNSILDRVHGKATQRLEVQSTAITFSIDLSGDGDDDTPQG